MTTKAHHIPQPAGARPELVETMRIIHPLWRLRSAAHPVAKPSAVPTDQRMSERSQPTTMLSGLHRRSAGPGKPAREKNRASH